MVRESRMVLAGEAVEMSIDDRHAVRGREWG
jgi:hypothetical protein